MSVTALPEVSPRTRHYAGLGEIATMARKSRQRVDNMTGNKGFPKPLADLSMGRVWDGEKVVAYMRQAGHPMWDVPWEDPAVTERENALVEPPSRRR
jgi:hypothetical protein